jgi:hypothetical protein
MNSSRAIRAVAWCAFGAYVAFTALALGLMFFQGASADAIGALGFAGFACVGVLIALRQPGNAVGWLLLAVAVAFAANSAGEAWVQVVDAGRVWVAWATNVAANLWFAPGLIILPLLFPDGHLVSPRWRPVLWLGIADMVLSATSAAFKPGALELQATARIDNPLGVDGGVPEALSTIDIVVSSVAVVLAAASVVVRFRRSRGLERQQLKWFALVGLLAATCLSIAIMFGSVLEVDGSNRWIPIAGWLSGLALLGIGMPLATGIAIFRHRLYDVDVVIRRTLVYAALTLTLGATYLGLVLLVGLAVGRSGIAVAISTLAVAALFRPVRTRIQGAVDRRFYRRRYDAARTLEEFGTRLRDELDLEALAADVRGIVHETVQPAHVSLWLRSER